MVPRSMPSIAVVAFDRMSPFHLAVPCAVFGDAYPGVARFRFTVCAAEPGPLRTSAGFRIETPKGLAVLRKADVIIVPTWRNPAERPPEKLLRALLAAHARGARIVGLCLGAYVLAEAGLLDGRRATTHWAFAEDFARRYPEVKLDADVLYVEEKNVLTSAGTAAGIDCCLHLLREYCGAESANRVARYLVVPPHRQGGQAQFVDQPLPATPAGSRLADLIDWLRAHLHWTLDLERVAKRALMSRRNFTRQFRALTGESFGGWLRRERLSHAQRLLENGGHTIERVAALAGFGSAVSLRAHFTAAFGVSPAAWRKNFRGK